MENLELYERVRSVPEEAKKEILAGRTKGFTDINPMWRIKKLTEEFGVCGIGWYFEVTDKHMEKCDKEIAAFVDIALYIKVGEEWSKAIYGTGGSRFATSERNGVYVSDECYKMATTDALSVACKHLGIGADVYFEKDITKYTKDTKSISKKEAQELRREIKRTGTEEKRILYTYAPKSVEELSKENYDDAMRKLKQLDNAPEPCPEEPTDPKEYSGLPFR